jgi:predicted dehydrogenase
VKTIIDQGKIGKAVNVQVRFAVPARQLDYDRPEQLPWRLQPEISGGGYFYDLAPHQLDLLQHLFGVITEARGICANRGGLYQAEDSVSASFEFEDGLPGSGSWCFVAHKSAREDRIQVIGTQGELSFSVFSYDPIVLNTSQGSESIVVENPDYVQYPIIKTVIEHLQGRAVCQCSSVSATPTNWVLDRILGKI